ncbi:MAG: chemotaxis-specific protein-glutamate methyltransferase CheB [Deltaproteobacteria bacterium]|nr:chemotaxis-specific protein-glutamate methyltransferase CheB [Deltaproteobacteria bacterium]
MTKPLRVMVVDDSVVNRQTIADVLREIEGVEVIARAVDGQEALRMAALLEPDFITLDLEMPRMDGFTFLRLLMASRPTPVLVVSSFSNVENMFKALELGAVDFVPRVGDGALLRKTLIEKLDALRHTNKTPVVSPSFLTRKTSSPVLAVRAPTTAPTRSEGLPKRLILVGCSTGGPQAIVDLIQRLPATFAPAILIAQHMPERFTTSFADRLSRRCALPVTEAFDAALVAPGTVWVCPGNRQSTIEVVGEKLRFRVGPLDPADRHAPPIDRLFLSAVALATRTTAVIMTGMGEDGALGAKELLKAGGELWVESAETAIVDGMPAAARKLGPSVVLPLSSLLARIASL